MLFFFNAMTPIVVESASNFETAQVDGSVLLVQVVGGSKWIYVEKKSIKKKSERKNPTKSGKKQKNSTKQNKQYWSGNVLEWWWQWWCV